jgi:hypothetical protein
VTEQLRTGPGFAVLAAPDGRLIDVELADADALIGQGYSYASREAAAAENERRLYADQTGQAALERGVRGVTFGAIEGVDPTESTEATRRRAQVFAAEHPLAEGAIGVGSELAVDLAITAATGGFGAGATRAARLARIGGEVAADAAASVSAERESAFQQSRDAKIGAAAGFGVGAGALGRGVVSLGGRLLRGRKVVAEAATEQAEEAAAHVRRTGEPAPDAPPAASVPPPAPAGYASPAPDVPPAPAPPGRAAAPGAPSPAAPGRVGPNYGQRAPQVSVRGFEEARAAAAEMTARQAATTAETARFDDAGWVLGQAKHTDAILEQQGSRMSRALDDLDDLIDDTVSVANKPGLAKRLVADDPGSRLKQLMFANETARAYDALIPLLERHAEQSGVKGLAAATSRLKVAASEALRKMGSVRAVDRAIGTDKFKRAMQKMHKKITRAQSKHIDPGAFEPFIDALDVFEKGRRFGLEDTKIWGEFGNYQRETNEWWHRRYLPNVYLTSRRLVQQVGEDYDSRGVFRWDVRAITSFLKQGRQEGDQVWRQLEQQLGARDELIDITRKFGLGRGGGREADRMGAALEEVRGAITSTENNREARRLAALMEPEATGLERALAGLRQYGGSLGGVLAASAEAATDATRAIAGASKRSAERVAGRPPRIPPGARRAIGRSLAAVSAIELLRGDEPSPEAGYADIIDRMRAFRRDPMAFGDALGAAFPGLAGANPELHARLAQRVAAAVGYLLEHAPPAVGIDAAHPGGVPPSRYDIEQWAELYAAAFHPESVYQALESGMATPAQTRTLSAVHPELYSDLLLDVLEAAGRNPEMTAEQRAQVPALFPELSGLGGALYAPTAAGMLGDAPASPAPSLPSGSGPTPTPSASLPSPTGGLSTGPTLGA